MYISYFYKYEDFHIIQFLKHIDNFPHICIKIIETPPSILSSDNAIHPDYISRNISICINQNSNFKGHSDYVIWRNQSQNARHGVRSV